MRTTLKDVAKEAGISFTLVSKYLTRNPGARMSPETKQRIDDALEKLNYRPSAVARSLKSGKTKTIGLVISDLRNPYFALFADYTLREVKNAGYQLLISLCGFGKEEEQENLRSLIERQCDGIIYCEQLFPASLTEQLEKERCPLILMDQKSDRFLYSKSDDRESLKQAVSFLASRGHKEISAVYSEYCDWQEIVENECRRNHLSHVYRITTPDTGARLQTLREVCRKAPSAILSNGWLTTVLLLRLIESEFPDYEPDIITNYYFHHSAFSDKRIAGIIRNNLPAMVKETVSALLKHLNGSSAENVNLSSEFVPAGRLRKTLRLDESEFYL